MGGLKREVCPHALGLQREGVRMSHSVTQPWVEAPLSIYTWGNRPSEVELVYLIPKPVPLISTLKTELDRPWDTGVHVMGDLGLEGKRWG